MVDGDIIDYAVIILQLVQLLLSFLFLRNVITRCYETW